MLSAYIVLLFFVHAQTAKTYFYPITLARYCHIGASTVQSQAKYAYYPWVERRILDETAHGQCKGLNPECGVTIPTP